MTAQDIDEPRMIYMGPAPPHFLRAEPAPREDALATQAPEAASPRLAVVVTAAAALTAGVAIGVFVTPLVRPPAAPAAAPARAPAPLVYAAASQGLSRPASEPAEARAAVALLTSAPTAAPEPTRRLATPATKHAPTTGANPRAAAAPPDQIGALLVGEEAVRHPPSDVAGADEAPH